jgi:dextranase
MANPLGRNCHAIIVVSRAVFNFVEGAQPSMNMPLIQECYPTRGAYAPGATALIRAECACPSAIPTPCILRAHLLALDAVVASGETRAVLRPNEVARIEVPLHLPPQDLRGYGVELELCDETGAVLACASAALDVCANWENAPRYGFVCDFSPSETDTRERMESMARYHLNAAQAYDWMYRHHDFLPPQTIFADALGRTQSLDVARRKIELARELGMQILAYAAIYAAPPDFIKTHPELGLYKLDGAPFSLADFLYNTDITNPRWRELFLRECKRTVDALGFDGIHLDQYGYPRLAHRLDGSLVDLEAALPDFLNAARKAIGDAPTVFNAVNTWTLEAVARSRMNPLYTEIWPPNDTLRDVREVVLRARALRDGRPPVIAAYINDLASDDAAKRAGALNAHRRLTAAIYLNGGSHISLGERNGVLADPYFPKYARLDAASASHVRRDYDFISRYAEYFFALGWRDVSATHVGGINEEIQLSAPRFGPNATPNSIWTIVREREGELTLGLVNLLGLKETMWNTSQTSAHSVNGICVSLQLERHLRGMYWASPDVANGSPQHLEIITEGRISKVVIPLFDMWGLLIVKYD